MGFGGGFALGLARGLDSARERKEQEAKAQRDEFKSMLLQLAQNERVPEQARNMAIQEYGRFVTSGGKSIKPKDYSNVLGQIWQSTARQSPQMAGYNKQLQQWEQAVGQQTPQAMGQQIQQGEKVLPGMQAIAQMAQGLPGMAGLASALQQGAAGAEQGMGVAREAKATAEKARPQAPPPGTPQQVTGMFTDAEMQQRGLDALMSQLFAKESIEAQFRKPEKPILTKAGDGSIVAYDPTTGTAEVVYQPEDNGMEGLTSLTGKGLGPAYAATLEALNDPTLTPEARDVLNNRLEAIRGAINANKIPPALIYPTAPINYDEARDPVSGAIIGRYNKTTGEVEYYKNPVTNKAPSNALQNAFQTVAKTYGLLQQMNEIASRRPDLSGILEGPLNRATQRLMQINDPDAIKLRTLVDLFRNKYRKDITGAAASVQELADIHRVVPLDDRPNFLGQVQVFLETAQRDMSLAGRTYGFDAEEYFSHWRPFDFTTEPLRPQAGQPGSGMIVDDKDMEAFDNPAPQSQRPSTFKQRPQDEEDEDEDAVSILDKDLNG